MPCTVQPEFTIADTTRAMQSRRLLATTIEDVRKAEDDFQKAHEKALQLDQEMAALEARIAALSGELGNKKSVLKAAHAEMDEMNKRIEYNLEKKNGLCIRCGIITLDCCAERMTNVTRVSVPLYHQVTG